jgi:hypothetical protein
MALAIGGQNRHVRSALASVRRVADHRAAAKPKPNVAVSAICTRCAKTTRIHGPLYSFSIRRSQQDSLLYT